MWLMTNVIDPIKNDISELKNIALFTDKYKGVDSSVTELNYLVGVTSNIQTQLDDVKKSTEYLNIAQATPNVFGSDFLNIDISFASAEIHKPAFFIMNASNQISNYPPYFNTTGTFYGIRTVYWRSNQHIMVEIKEMYPVSGRVHTNFYNNGIWSGWKSINYDLCVKQYVGGFKNYNTDLNSILTEYDGNTQEQKYIIVTSGCINRPSTGANYDVVSTFVTNTAVSPTVVQKVVGLGIIPREFIRTATGTTTTQWCEYAMIFDLIGTGSELTANVPWAVIKRLCNSGFLPKGRVTIGTIQTQNTYSYIGQCTTTNYGSWFVTAYSVGVNYIVKNVNGTWSYEQITTGAAVSFT